MNLSNYNDLLASYGIETVFQKAAFYAQIDHESQGFTRTSENLNYSVLGLLNTFHKYFNNQTANDYARKPQAIANHVYANRMGNGNEASGDGWKYRGSGYIQLTGKDNHSAFAQYKGMSLNVVSDYMRTEQGAMESACWYWKSHNLNDYCKDVVACTRRVNGGLNGLKERKALYDKYLKELANENT